MSTQKLFKRVLTGVLTASIAFSGAALQSSAITTFKMYQTNYQTASSISAREEININHIIAWVNGGKAKYEIADFGITVDVDGKVATVALNAETGSDGVDITSSKSVIWGIVDSDGAAIATGVGSDGIPTGGYSVTAKPSASLKVTVGTKDVEVFKVAAGKVTAGKVPGSGMVGIYKAIKSGTTTTYYLLAKFPVEIKMAPASMSTFTDSSGIVWTGSASEKTKATTALQVGLDEISAPLYVVPKDSSSATDSSGINSASTYTVSVDSKSLEYIELLPGTTGSGGADTKIEINVINDYAFRVKGVDLAVKTNADGDVTSISNPKANVTITNNQSGKSCKVSVTVVNGAKSVLGTLSGSDGVKVYSDGAFAVDVYKAVKASSLTFDVNDYKVNSDGTVRTTSDGIAVVSFDRNSVDVTVKPTVGVFNKVPVMSELVSAGKIKFDYGTKSANKGTSTIALDGKSNKKFKFTPKAADLSPAVTEYIVIAYGTTADQIAVIPVTLQSTLISTTITIPVKGLTSDGVFGSDGVTIVDSSNVKQTVTSATMVAAAASDGTGTLTITANLLPGTKYKVSLVKTSTPSVNQYVASGIDVTTGKVKTTPAATTDDWGKAKLPTSVSATKPWALTCNAT